MKVKAGFIRRQLASQQVVVAVGEASKSFNGLVRLNESGAFLWDRLATDQTEQQLVEALLAEYDVDEKTAQADVSVFLETIRREGLLDD